VVALLLAVHLLESLQTEDRLHHALHQHQEMSVQLAAEDLIAQGLLVKFRKVAKSAIHAGFVPLLKNEINHVFVHVSLNQIFLKTLPVKS
jgi:hypothetical protein